MFRFRNLFLTLGAVAALACMSGKAQADTITVVGVENGAAATATVTCDLIGNTFTFTITNTSPSGSTITGIGFDLIPGDFDASDPNATGLNGFSGAQANAVPIGSSAFTFSDAALGNVAAGFGSTVVLDFGFLTGNNFNGGNVGSGISPGESATFSVTSTLFTSLNLSPEDVCNAIFVRFQAVPVGSGSDVGTPTSIPEPSSMLLLGSALIGLGGFVRRRIKR
jgi:hypothetical protein